MKPLRVVFAGTPQFSVAALEALSHQATLSLQAIYTQPDRPAGRGQSPQASPIKQWGQAHALPIYQPTTLKSPEAVQAFQALQPDLLIVIAYGLILPKALLAIPRLGCLNVHTSLLPKYRGASPIQGALLAGDSRTGVSIMQMDEGMDTGPIYTQATLAIAPHETAGTLHDKLMALSVPTLLGVIETLIAGTATLTPQDAAQATYTHKIQKEDARIDWTHAAEVISRHIRAYAPWPVAFTQSAAVRIRLWQAEVALTGATTGKPGEILALDATGLLVATGAGVIRIQQLQFPGGKVMAASAWRHAHSSLLQVGECLY